MREGRLKSVTDMLESLKAVTAQGDVILGHQNAGHIGVGIRKHDGTESDISIITGTMPGIVGIDTLSFLGYEGKMNDLIKIVKNLHRKGCYITLSAHMCNFSLGSASTYYDYSPNNTSGDCGRRIMPGGDLNAKYTHFLDMIVHFASECVDIKGKPIPMIFRPFHECNGDWFWWGKSSMTDEEYIALFRYTIGYLESNGVNSFAYCYSPNGFADDVESFMARYPGDDIVDIIGMDLYHDRPSEGDGFFEKLDDSLATICRIADEKNIIPALTEIGLRTLDSKINYYEGLAPEGNPATWFTDLGDVILKHRIAYFLFWANFSDLQFWVPYIRGSERHEMTDNFLKLADNSRIVFAPAFDME